MSFFTKNDNQSDPSLQPGVGFTLDTAQGPAMSGLSGNELYCIGLLGYTTGSLVVGNCVYSIGLVGSLFSNIKIALGGELSQVTNMINQGRLLSFERLEKELRSSNMPAVTGLSSEVIFHQGNIEFLAMGSAIYKPNEPDQVQFSNASNGQDLYCQIDAYYQPKKFVFGNVAYSIGLAKSIIGNLKELRRGEISQFSDIFNTTRNLALARIKEEARQLGANTVVGIKTQIIDIPENPIQEMIMVGTASINPLLNDLAASLDGVLTSGLSARETWNIARMGYVPLELVLGTSVFSLGLAGGIKASLSNLVKGEITVLSELIYQAREESLKKVKAQATTIGSDDVLGIKTYVYQIEGGLVEIMSIGTAVKRFTGNLTSHDSLPPQALINDSDSLFYLSDQYNNLKQAIGN